jgi:hypothetical protein
MIRTNAQRNYYIAPYGISFVENALGNPALIQVSVSIGTTITAYEQGVIGYAGNKNYREWKLTGYNTRLVNAAHHYIYARVGQSDSSADGLIIFSTKNYNTDGSIQGDSTSQASTEYFYIKIGEVTATNAELTTERELTYDSGCLTSDETRNSSSGLEEMFELDKSGTPWLIRAKQFLAGFTVKGYITLLNGLLFKGGEKLTGLFTSSSQKADASDETAVTSKYLLENYLTLEEMDARYLSKLNDDTAHGKITFQQGLDSLGDVNISENISISKNATVVGAAFVSENVTVDGDSTVGGSLNVAGSAEIGNDVSVKGSIDAGSAGISGRLDVGGTAAVKGDLAVGDFMRSLYAGSGAGVDEQGNMEVESLRVRSYAEFMELIINRLSAIEGDQLLTEADTIESVDDLGDNCYGLHLRSKWEGYFTAQVENNVLKGIINTLASGSGTYYTSWMRVNSVNTASNYIEVTMYPDDEVPAGKNFPPCAMMNIARWGNQTDTTRQKCLYLSSTDGDIRKLVNVTKPIIDTTNEGMKLGDVPDWLKDDVRVDPTRDYIYAMGIICQNIIQVDYKGQPVATVKDRGTWVTGGTYYSSSMNEDGVYEISDVWYNGCKYRCMKDKTDEAPAWNSTDWAMVEGNPNFTVDFAEADQLYSASNFKATLTVVAMLYNFDITDDILDNDVQWTRYSEDADGNPRPESDNLWAIKRAGAGKSISLTLDDLDAKTSTGFPKTVAFTATVTLRDGMGNEAATATATMNAV